MALPANSQMFVDLSGDNDHAGALAAASAVPSADAGFERSCDNPKCSAPKLISLVPKRETAEFITEPIVIPKPTLVNGFTTVFQIDGIGARMNEIMYGDNSDPNSSNGGPPKPKSVFRIVPNTHAHIVNYVVVDGAGETMRKIKANDKETMRKLVDSQRQSAEQMLKKLIGRAFKPPSRQSVTPVPQPKILKVPESTTLPQPTIKPVMSAAAMPEVKAVPAETNFLPAVPPGITITPLPLPEASPNLNIPSVDLTTPAPKQLVLGQTSTSSTIQSAPVLRRALVNPPAQQTKSLLRPTTLKRKLVMAPIPDAFKRLRSRSPKQKTPMAVGLLPPNSAYLANKSPSLSLPVKLPTNPVAKTTPQSHKAPEKLFPKPIAITTPTEVIKTSNPAPEVFSRSKEKESILVSSIKTTAPLTTPAAGKIITLSETFKTDTPQSKPIIEPSSQMDPLKSLVATRAPVHATQSEVAYKQSIGKIGETIITSTRGAVTKLLPITKPCTVSIPKFDVPIIKKISESENVDIAPKHQTTAYKTVAAPAKTNTMVSSNATTVQQSSKLNDADPLSLGHDKSYLTPTSTNAPTSVPTTRTTAAMKSVETTSPKILKLQPKPLTVHKLESALPTRPSPLPTKSHPQLPMKITRSSTPKVMSSLPTLPTRQSRVSTPATKALASSPAIISETSSSQQSKGLNVVLPTIKNKSGIMTIPTSSSSAHPNLKISSVMSGGSLFAERFGNDNNLSSSNVIEEDDSGPNIEKLQKELADLRRTVARLSSKKKS